MTLNFNTSNSKGLMLNKFTNKLVLLNSTFDRYFQEEIYNNPNIMCLYFDRLFIVDWNDSLNKSLGWSNKELGNIPWLDLIHPNERHLATWVSQSEGLFFSQNKVDFFYHRYRHKNGSYRWIKFYRQSFPYANGWYIIAEDVTDYENEAEFLETLRKVRDGI